MISALRYWVKRPPGPTWVHEIAELRVRQDRDDRFAGLDDDWLSRFQIGTCGSLLNDAGLLNHADVGSGAAIADGRFIGIHLHKSIVQAHPGESGKNMLDSMNLDVAFDDAWWRARRF